MPVTMTKFPVLACDVNLNGVDPLDPLTDVKLTNSIHFLIRVGNPAVWGLTR